MKSKKINIFAFLVSLLIISAFVFNSSNFGFKKLRVDEYKISLLDDNLKGDYGFKIYEIKVGDKLVAVDQLDINGWHKSNTDNGYPIYIDKYTDNNFVKFIPGTRILFNGITIKRDIGPGYWFCKLEYSDKKDKISASNSLERVGEETYKYQSIYDILFQYLLLAVALFGLYFLLKELFNSKSTFDKNFIVRLIKACAKLGIMLIILNFISSMIKQGEYFTLFGRRMTRYDYFMFIVFSFFFTLGSKYFLKNDKNISKIYGYIIFFLTPLVGFLVGELAYNEHIFDMKITDVLINYIIMVLLELAFLIIFRSKNFASTIILWLPIIFGIANQVLIEIRNTPMIPSFLANIVVAVNVAGDTDISFTSSSIGSFVYGIIWQNIIGSTSHIKLKKQGLRAYIKELLICIPIFLVIIIASDKFYFTNLSKMEFNWWQPMKTYYSKGSPQSFYALLLNQKLKKPDDYNEDEIIELLENYKNIYPKPSSINKQPNVVVILSEALMDYQGFGDNIYYNEDPLEFTKSITENMIKGEINMSIVGGGTIKSEYEVLTGNVLSFFQPGSEPSQQYIKKIAIQS